MGRGGSWGVSLGLEGGTVVNEHAETIDKLIQRLRSGTKSQISSTYRGVTITGIIDKKGTIIIMVRGLK